MPASIVARSAAAFTIQIEIPYASSMLDFEEAIQKGLNEAGTLATTEALQQFDADGSPITVGDTKLTSKGKLTKEYQAPYGRRARRAARLPEQPGRQDLLPARP